MPDEALYQQAAPAGGPAAADLLLLFDVSDGTDYPGVGSSRAAAVADVLALKAVPAGRTLFVDQVNGNNATAARGDATRPFLTLAGAKAAHQAGDVIRVGPGTYNEQGLGKAGAVYWYGEPGAKIQLASASGSTPTAVFNDPGAATTLVVRGFFEFVRNNANTLLTYSNVVTSTHTGSAVDVQCRTMEGGFSVTSGGPHYLAFTKTYLNSDCPLTVTNCEASLYFDYAYSSLTVSCTGAGGIKTVVCYGNRILYATSATGNKAKLLMHVFEAGDVSANNTCEVDLRAYTVANLVVAGGAAVTNEAAKTTTATVTGADSTLIAKGGSYGTAGGGVDTLTIGAGSILKANGCTVYGQIPLVLDSTSVVTLDDATLVADSGNVTNAVAVALTVVGGLTISHPLGAGVTTTGGSVIRADTGTVAVGGTVDVGAGGTAGAIRFWDAVNQGWGGTITEQDGELDFAGPVVFGGNAVLEGDVLVNGALIASGASLSNLPPPNFSAVNNEAGTVLPGTAVAVIGTGTGVVKASAATAARPAVGVAAAGVGAGSSGSFLTGGKLTLADWSAVVGAVSLVKGQLYYLSPTTAGRLTAAVPTTAGQVVQCVGVGLTTDTLDILLEPPILL